MARVRNKAGEELGAVSAGNVEEFLREQAALHGSRGKPAKMAIGLQCPSGCQIITSAAEMALLDEGLASDGDLIVATKGRRGYEIWKCV